MRWERVPQAGGNEEACSWPGKRWGHTCNSVKGGRFLYVFGGYGQYCQTNQVHVFDTDKQSWSKPVMKGTPPSARDSHSCTTIGDNLFVFGGTDGMVPLKDLHILETSTNTWISPSVRGEGPDAREGHGAAVVGKRLFVFGGCGKSSDNDAEIYYNDLYILNTETFVWKRAQTSGNPPSARDSHTCSSWKNKIIVIGGEDADDAYLCDVHILDTDTLAWKELSTSGLILPPRAGHSTVALGKNIFVFGGFTDAQNLYDDLYMLDVETGLWTRVITLGEGPSARFSVSGDCLDPVKSGALIFIGGCNKTLESLDDMYYLYTGLVVMDDKKFENLSLRKQLKLKCQQQNLGNLVHDKALVSNEVDNDVHHQHIPLFSYDQPRRDNFSSNQVQLDGKKNFIAEITESFPHGCTINTVIEGKPFRGILFSNKPSSVHVANYNLCRKRTSVEGADTVLNGDSNRQSKSLRSMVQACGDHKLGDIHEKDYSLNETAAPAPSSGNPAHSDLSTHEDLAKQEQSISHPNLHNDKSSNAPNSGSEVLKATGSTRTDFSVPFSPKNADERRPNALEPNNPGISLGNGN